MPFLRKIIHQKYSYIERFKLRLGVINMNDCIEHCRLEPNCLVFAFKSDGGDPNASGTCWLKKEAGSVTPSQPDYISGILVDYYVRIFLNTSF